MNQFLKHFDQPSVYKMVEKKLSEHSEEFPLYSRGFLSNYYFLFRIREDVPEFEQVFQNSFLPSNIWQHTLDASSNPQKWLDLAESSFSENNILMASLALASFHWLDTGSPNTRKLKEEIDKQLLKTGIKPFHNFYNAANEMKTNKSIMDDSRGGVYSVFHYRHWMAWSMAQGGSHNYVPALLDYSSDEKFLLRTRIYRTLGQSPHPFSILCLQEATNDLHPFARAQAIRSLGQNCDPTFVGELISIANEDNSNEVKRVAKKALQRIVGYWEFYGEWKKILESDEKIKEKIYYFLDIGFDNFASKLIESTVGSIHQVSKLDERMTQFIKEYRNKQKPELYENFRESSHYSDYFPDANEFEKSLEWPEQENTSYAYSRIQNTLRLLRSRDCDELMLGLYLTSRHGLKEFKNEIITHTQSENEHVAWNARRALRRLGIGTLEQRKKGAFNKIH
ncbi:MAG: HEAT repeat domain-containing protein [Bacteroidales bacterium]|nr:HEAT repeat domain-containing protein [Bacteroidales bacterium]MCF8456676.1 HEAT repeat domain-containing protein [Bacteroidales bacterium]